MSPKLIGAFSCFVLILLFHSRVALGDLSEAKAAFEQGDYSVAKRLYLKEKGSISAQLGLARIYMETDLGKAEKWVEKALGQDIKNSEAHYIKGIILGKQAEESIFSAISLARKAKKSFETALSGDEENAKYIDALIKFHTRAPGIAGGDIETAKSLLDKLEEIDKKAAYKSKFEYLKETNKIPEAENLLTEAQAMFPDSPFFNYEAAIIAQKNKNYAKAFDFFSKTCQAKETNTDDLYLKLNARYQYARTAVFSQRNLSKGVLAMEQFIADYPYNPTSFLPSKDWAQYRLASLYELQGLPEKARNIYLSLKVTEDKTLRENIRKKIK